MLVCRRGDPGLDAPGELQCGLHLLEIVERAQLEEERLPFKHFHLKKLENKSLFFLRESLHFEKLWQRKKIVDR